MGRPGRGRPFLVGGSLRAVTPENAWIYAILPFLTMAVLTVGFIVVFRQRAKTRRAAAAPRTRPAPASPSRAWWLQPWAWIAIVVAALMLGTLVWPGLYALVLVVVPLAWLGRPHRRPAVDPRSNGHAHRDGGAFTSE
jgi:hypothetical protein